MRKDRKKQGNDRDWAGMLGLTAEGPGTRASTARACVRYQLRDRDGKRYRLDCCHEAVPRYYLRRRESGRKVFSREFPGWFRTLAPLRRGQWKGWDYELLPWFDGAKQTRNDDAVFRWQEALKHSCPEQDLTPQLQEKILNDFLAAWPPSHRPAIRRLPGFREYADLLGRQTRIRLGFEHGDFTPNNLLETKDGLLLIDFEFWRSNQPLGFDLYDWFRARRRPLPESWRENRSLHAAKFRLIEEINHHLDRWGPGVISHARFDAALLQEWRQTPGSDGEYSLSPDWCRIWYRHFGRGKPLLVLAGYDEDGMSFLAPGWMPGGNWQFLGTDPDLFDGGGILCRKATGYTQFARALLQAGLSLDLRYLPAEGELLRTLVRQSLQSGEEIEAEWIDTRPYLLGEWRPERSLRNDLTRLERKFEAVHGTQLHFLLETDDPEAELDELIRLHRRRWPGGAFDRDPRLAGFYRDLLRETELLLISRLESIDGRHVPARHLGYRCAGGRFVSVLPAFDPAYSQFSPGKILLGRMIPALAAVGLTTLDFGRGTEDYKYRFANEDKLLAHFRLSRGRYVYQQVQRLARGFLRRWQRH